MGNVAVTRRLFFCAFGPKLRSDKSQVFTKTQTIFSCKTQVFEAFASRSVNKGFPKLRSKAPKLRFLNHLYVKMFQKKPHKKSLYILCLIIACALL